MSGVVSDPISVQMEMSEDVSIVQMSRIWLAWLHHTLSCPGVTMSTFHTSSLQYSLWARVTIVCSHIIQLSLMSVPVPCASGRPGCCYLHLKFFVSKHPTLFCIKSNVTHYTLLHITPYTLLQSRALPRSGDNLPNITLWPEILSCCLVITRSLWRNYRPVITNKVQKSSEIYEA